MKGLYQFSRGKDKKKRKSRRNLYLGVTAGVGGLGAIGLGAYSLKKKKIGTRASGYKGLSKTQKSAKVRERLTKLEEEYIRNGPTRAEDKDLKTFMPSEKGELAGRKYFYNTSKEGVRELGKSIRASKKYLITDPKDEYTKDSLDLVLDSRRKRQGSLSRANKYAIKNLKKSGKLNEYSRF